MYKYILFFLLFLSFHIEAEDEQLAFSKVFQVMYDEDSQQFAITDKGVWQIIDSELVRIDNKQDESQVYLLKDHLHLFPNRSVTDRAWYDLASFGYVVLLLIFIALYLYYQSALNRRRKAFYERIKAQQQILNIAFWATGDEVVDIDIKANKLTRLNQNANLLKSTGIHFQSKEFISQLHSEDCSSFVAQFESLISSGLDNYEITYRISDEEQNWIWIAEHGTVIERDTQGKATRIISNMRDISSLKLEQELLIRMVDELEIRLKRAESALMR